MSNLTDRIPTGHTPGPWKVIWWGNESYPYPLSVHTEDNANWICRGGDVAREADALLIALAPELAAAAIERDHFAELYAKEGHAKMVLQEYHSEQLANMREALDEGVDILVSLIANIKRKGNYTPESTCSFIEQAIGAFNAASRAFGDRRAG